MSRARTPLRRTLAVAVALALAPVASAAAADFDGNAATTERVDESTPTAAAVEISQDRFANDAADYVVLSRDDIFADSLAAAALTADGPLLFTQTGALPDATRDEIDRVLANGGLVYLLGGSAAINNGVETQLENAGYQTQRLEGATRIETAVAVANVVRFRRPSAAGAPRTVAIARAYGPNDTDTTAAWADSVTGGGWAAYEGVPILLTRTEEMHPATAEFIASDGPAVKILFGGNEALSPAVETAAGAGARRVFGGAREDTAAAIARDLWGVAPIFDRGFVIIDGYRTDGWAYGLAAAGIAAEATAPILVIAQDRVPLATLELVASCDVPRVDLLLVGSTSVISAARQEELDEVDGEPCQTAHLLGSEEVSDGDEVPEGDPDGSGEAWLMLFPARGIVCTLWDDVAGITLPSAAAHIHQAPAGANGPVVVPLEEPVTDGPEWGCVDGQPGATLTAAQTDPASFYVNVHTSDYPDGAIRGQLNSVGG